MVTQKDNLTLPELDNEDRELALSHEGKLFALDLLDPQKLGYFSWIQGLGVALQNVGDNTVRCICIYDDAPAYKHLAMINASITSVGGALEFGEFTVRKQWNPEDAKNSEEKPEKPEVSGMEVA